MDHRTEEYTDEHAGPNPTGRAGCRASSKA